MSRLGQTAVLVVWGCILSAAPARGADDLPALSAPGDRAPTEPIAQPAEPPKPPESSNRRPVLIVPGVPGGSVPKPRTPTRSSLAATSAPGPIAPKVGNEVKLEATIRSNPRSLGAHSPPALEPSADEVFNPFRDAEPLSAPTDPRGDPPRIENPKGVRDPREPKRIPVEVVDEDAKPPVAPARPRSRFSLWPFNRRQTASTTKPSFSPLRNAKPKPARDLLQDPLPESRDREPARPDPAAESTLKRLLEKRIGEVAGDRLKEFEVLVIDRRVIVRARVQRFWQRSAVRKAIESLHELTGYRATVDVY